MNPLRFLLRSIIFMDLPGRVPDRCMGDAIAREAKRKRPHPNRDRTAVCDLMPVRFQGMTPVSDGDKKDLWRFDSPGAGCTIGAPSAWIFLVRLHCRA